MHVYRHRQYSPLFKILTSKVYLFGFLKIFFLSEPYHLKSRFTPYVRLSSALILFPRLFFFFFFFFFSAWNHSSTNKHLLNSVYALVNLLFTAKPVRLLHVYHPFIYILVYVIFNVIYYKSGGGFVYRALDWGRASRAVLVVTLVLLLGVPLVHTFCFALYRLRVFISSKYCKANVSVSNGAEQRNVELNEIS